MLFSCTKEPWDSFLVGDYRSILDDVNEGRDFHSSLRYNGLSRDRYKVAKPAHRFTGLEWLEDVVKEKPSIVATIHQSTLNEDAKAFLVLYLTSIFAYSDLEAFDTVHMQKEVNDFLDTFPTSSYSRYTESVLYAEFETRKLGLGAGFFSGYALLNGNISDYFNSFIPIGGILELGYKKYLLKADISGSFSRSLKRSFEYKDNFWSSDSTLTVFNGTLNFAYIISDNAHYRVAPFIGVGTSGVNISSTEDNLVSRPNLNVGLDIDWKFSTYNSYGSYTEAFSTVKDKTYWYLRFSIGYSQLMHAEDHFHGGVFRTKLAVGFFSNPSKRVSKDLLSEQKEI